MRPEPRWPTVKAALKSNYAANHKSDNDPKNNDDFVTAHPGRIHLF
jgi:hypothetical protein